MSVVITRTYQPQETLGTLVAEKNDQQFRCFTLELPNLGNQPEVSCIPEGTYLCVYTQSAHLKDTNGNPLSTYEVMNVPNRSGIRIHSANFFKQLLGCIALGYKEEDLNADNVLDITDSRNAVNDFEKFMNYEQFNLVITSNIII